MEIDDLDEDTVNEIAALLGRFKKSQHPTYMDMLKSFEIHEESFFSAGGMLIAALDRMAANGADETHRRNNAVFMGLILGHHLTVTGHFGHH